MFGIGGGLILVPALILVFNIDSKTAIGTSLLAQLLPVGLLGVREYWRRGEVAIGPGLWIAGGLVIGVLLGALITGRISPTKMRQLYGLFLVAVGIYFLLAPQGVTRKPQPRTAPPAASSETESGG
jgi:hypothetical protein